MYHSRWKGTHDNAGRRYGEILRKKSISLTANFGLSAEKAAFAKQCIPIYAHDYPPILEEIRGIADGAGIAEAELIQFLLGMYCFTPDAHCSCFAFCNQHRQTIFGRNSDFLTSVEPFCDSAYYCLNGGYAFIGNTTAMTEMEDGINAYGLAAGLTFVYPVRIKPGWNAGMLVRCILETCRSVDEAICFLRKVPIASSQTITLADAGGNVAAVECSCEKVSVIRPHDRCVYQTNHFVSREMLPYQCHIPDDIFSHTRYDTLHAVLPAHKIQTVQNAQDLLSGKYGFLCQYDRRKGMDTVWSCVYQVTEGRIYRAEGNPSRKGYHEDKRLNFLSKP